MKALFCGFVTLILVNSIVGDNCPTGGEIYTRGISKDGQKDVVRLHNQYRQMIIDGKVQGQPKGKKLLKMVYDSKLGKAGRVVSNSCVMKHIIGQDSRWKHVGQNLYISWSSVKDTKQDWSAALKAWFDEYKDFTYPNKSRGVTGHYTQVVWATSEYLGCDYIAFYDKTKPKYPYARLYTCNYGPGGNIRGQSPYPLA